MRFFVGLAAAVWTLRNMGPVGWVLVGLLAAVATAAVLVLWPFILVAAAGLGVLYLARQLGRRRHA